MWLKKKIKKDETDELAVPLPDDPTIKEYDAKKADGKVQKVKRYFYPNKTFLVEMDLRNGDSTEFTICPSSNEFRYQGGTYVIDTSMKKWCSSARLYKLKYHQDCSVPIDQKYDINRIKSLVTDSGTVWSWMSLNPSTLDVFTDAKLAEQAMKGQKIDEFLRGLNWKIIVILISVVLHLLMFLQASGFFKGLANSLPF